METELELERQEAEAAGPSTCDENSIILTLSDRHHKADKLANRDVMPAWAATKSLLLSCASQRPCRTNSEVIASLFRTPPTYYGTLYTVLMLTQNISAFAIGP